MAATSYPFVPKSAVSLSAGEIWAIPLRDGSFGCGRVLQPAVQRQGASRVIFLAGLMDWHEDVAPTESTIAGAKCLAQGKAHVKCIRETGGSVLGLRSLELERVKPAIFLSGLGEPSGIVMRGLEHVRKATIFDRLKPQLTLWGFAYIRALAEHEFLDTNTS
jgi:hypothetical protein